MTTESNPYAAPQSIDHEPVHSANKGLRLASREARFLAALIDGVFSLVLGLVPAIALSVNGYDPLPITPAPPFFLRTPSGLLAGLCGIIPTLIQIILVATSGQSVGKKLVGNRIALADGTTAGFYNAVLLRMGPLLLLSFVSIAIQSVYGPKSGTTVASTLIISVLGLIDVLGIFRADYRCFHDSIAGTWVVSLKAPVKRLATIS